MEEVMAAVNSEVFGVWFLIGAALVFWMQAGFAMVETGFTRANNAGNILMKNLMDFCIGTVVFVLLGFGLFLGEDTLFGLLGKPNLDILTNYAAGRGQRDQRRLLACVPPRGQARKPGGAAHRRGMGKRRPLAPGRHVRLHHELRLPKALLRVFRRKAH